MIYKLKLQGANGTVEFIRHGLRDVLETLGSVTRTQTPPHLPNFHKEAMDRATRAGQRISLTGRLQGAEGEAEVNLAQVCDKFACDARMPA